MQSHTIRVKDKESECYKSIPNPNRDKIRNEQKHKETCLKNRRKRKSKK